METQVSVWARWGAMILISLGMIGLSRPADSHPMLSYWQNRTGSHSGLLLEPRFGYFATSNNYDSTGAQTPVSGVATNTRMSLDLNGSYGVSDDFFLFGRLSALSTRVSTFSGTTDRSSMGLSDQLAGFAYRLLSSDSGFGLNFQAEATLPAYSNVSAKAGNSLYMGDGTVDVTGGAFLEIPLGSGRETWLEFGGGYTYRSKGFSAAVPYSALVKHDPEGGGLLIEAGVMGQFSLKTDIATNSPSLQTQTNTDRAAGAGILGATDGSYLINGMNPSWMMAEGKLGFKTRSGQSWYAGGSLPFSGTNAPSGISMVIGAVFDFNSGPSGPETGKPMNARAGGKERVLLSPRKEFQSYDLDAKVTSYNDTLFLVKIDKGKMDLVEKGQLFDIFLGDDPVARAQVSHVKDDESALTVLEYYQDHWIETGFTARRVVR
ncbi:MAG: hypothetical protein EBX52_04395 [Proteobacteria bacterium]|nr:hypothetical protein [Pseudomonadota bacterium]